MKNIIKYLLSLGRRRLIVTGVVDAQKTPKPAQLNLLPKPKRYKHYYKHTKK